MAAVVNQPVNSSPTKRYPMVVRAFGASAAGAVPLSRGVAAVADIVVGVRNFTTLADASSSFESTISVAGQIQQTSGSDLHLNEYWFFLMPL